MLYGADTGFSEASGASTVALMIMSLALKQDVMVLFQFPDFDQHGSKYMGTVDKAKVRPLTPYFGQMKRYSFDPGKQSAP